MGKDQLNAKILGVPVLGSLENSETLSEMKPCFLLMFLCCKSRRGGSLQEKNESKKEKRKSTILKTRFCF